jgi:hypothetical protein
MPGGKKDLSPTQQALSDAKHVVEHTVGEKAVHGVAHSLSKAAPLAAKAIGGVASKVLPAVAGGVPGAVVSAFSGNSGRGFNEMQKTRADMVTPENASKRASMYRSTPKLMMSKKMVTVKSPAYSGQSTMGKAMMASAKKKV